MVSNYPKSKFFYLAEDFLQFFEIFSSSRHLLLFCYTDTIPNCNIQSRDMPLSRYTDNVFLCIYSKMSGMEWKQLNVAGIVFFGLIASC